MGRASVGALSTAAVRERLRSPTLKDRLVISPLLNHGTQAKDGQAAVDVRLGFEFCLVVASSFGAISEFGNGDSSISNFNSLYQRRFVPFGGKIVIHPHQFVLAQTLEYLRFPRDLMAYVVGRSTWGRLGLIVATAVGIHPNFAGNLTLELRNLGETPLTLFPGQAIAQLFFHQVSGKDGQPSKLAAAGAQYVGTVDMVPRKLSDDLTHSTIERLIRYREKRSSAQKPRTRRSP